MTRNRPYVAVHSMILVEMEQRFIHRPESAESLGRIALEVLVAELGTEGARLFLRSEFAKYLRDYRGFLRDPRHPREDRACMGYTTSAHTSPPASHVTATSDHR